MQIKAKKSLGQNFLVDKNILEKISNSCEINKVSENNISAVKSNKNINVINVDFKFQKPFDKISIIE